MVNVTGFNANHFTSSGCFSATVDIGKTTADATAILDELGLELSITGEVPSNEFDPGQIVTQDPESGKVDPGAFIEVTVASGPETVVIADYIESASGNVFTYTPENASSRAILHVDFTVNVNPNEGWKDWRLVDDIVLRNTLRQ